MGQIDDVGQARAQRTIDRNRTSLLEGCRCFCYEKMKFKRMTIRVRGSAKGSLLIRTAPQGEALAKIEVTPSREWTAYTAEWAPCAGVHPLYLCCRGKGKLDILDFSF